MAQRLPDYVTSAKPVPPEARVPWFAGIAPTYAGVMVWFLFWENVPGYGGTPGGLLSAGLLPALLGVVAAALIIHFLFYLVPGLLGMRTGLPLYVVGTSTYGVHGGILVPGLFMGILQFFWVGFNAFFVARVLCQTFEIGVGDSGDPTIPGMAHGAIAVVWAIAAAFVGLKGIQYVAKVATYLPIIPIAVLLILTVSTIGGVGAFDPDKLIEAQNAAAAAAPEEAAEEALAPLGALDVILAMIACIVGFFATAGAAGVDISMSAKEGGDVHKGGLIGIALATAFSAGLACVVVAGYYGGAEQVPVGLSGKMDPIDLMQGGVLSEQFAKVLMILLAISSFPAACFSSFIAANSFKTTLPKIDARLSVGVGAAVACVLAVTGWAGNAAGIFGLIGASFGPVCGAMVADYLLAGRKWSGPRAGFNLAGWISWVVGFAVGAWDLFAMIPGQEHLKGMVPCVPMAAFVVGFVLYYLLAKAGLETESIPLPELGSDSPSSDAPAPA